MIAGLSFGHIDVLVAFSIGLVASFSAWLALRRPRYALEAWVLVRIHNRAAARCALEGSTGGALSRGGSTVAVPIDVPPTAAAEDVRIPPAGTAVSAAPGHPDGE